MSTLTARTTKPKLSTATKRWLRAVPRRLKNHPKWYSQSKATVRKNPKRHSCGAPMCIIGHGMDLTSRQLSKRKQEEIIKTYGLFAWRASTQGAGTSWHFPSIGKLLGLTSDQFDRLFMAHNWPGKFWRSDNDEVRPSLAIKRIDHFIRTEGAE